MDNAVVEWVPKVGMEFNTFDEARLFWRAYGGKMGFSVRQQYANKIDGKITTSGLCCNKQGFRRPDKRDSLTKKPRAETRTGCEVVMRIALIPETSKYRVHYFVSRHNHSLHVEECCHMMPSQRKMTDAQAFEVELANDSGLRPKATYEFMGRQAGGRENLGYTRQDQKNHLRNKRKQELGSGEGVAVVRYFQKKQVDDPSFYYAVDFDESDHITNFFWADARMRMDYSTFGDVITFDTTYATNKEYRPFGVFTGFNHHRTLVIFGAALLYDETAKSFTWLFQQFLETHKGKMPKTIFTDQDAAMAKALNEVMSGTRHGLCTWHIMYNGIKHHGNLLKGESNFLKDFKNLMYEYVDESKFEESWRTMLLTYPVKDSGWLNGIYKVKEKWANCFMMTAFTIGMRSTQLSESLNSDLKDYLKYDLDVVQFFKHFERVVDEKRYNELEKEYHAVEKLPRLKVKTSPVLKQAAQVYTPYGFQFFQEEWEKMFELCVQILNQIDVSLVYLVNGKAKDCVVVTTKSGELVICSCRMFERMGFLCCHVLKVLDIMNIKLIPRNYIMKRWTREGRSGTFQKVKNGEAELNNKLNVTERYKNLCREYIKLATQAAYDVEEYEYMMKASQEFNKRLDDKVRIQPTDGNVKKDIKDSNDSTEKLIDRVRGLKKGNGRKGGKRPKSWVENQPKEKKKTKKKQESNEVLDEQSKSLVEKQATKRKKETIKRKVLQSSPQEFQELSNVKSAKIDEDQNPFDKLPKDSNKESTDISVFKEELEESGSILSYAEKNNLYKLRDVPDSEINDMILDAFDPRIRRHIVDNFEDVAADGNCGYRCCAELLGLCRVDGWKIVRQSMLVEWEAHKDLYVEIMGGEKRYIEIGDKLNCFITPCPFKYWMTLPDMGLLFATAFNCVLCVVSPHSYFTYLPLRGRPPKDIKFIQLLLYERSRGCKHFLKFSRKTNAPIPPIYLTWERAASKESITWGSKVFELIEGWEALVGLPLPEQLPSIQISLNDRKKLCKAT